MELQAPSPTPAPYTFTETEVAWLRAVETQVSSTSTASDIAAVMRDHVLPPSLSWLHHLLEHELVPAPKTGPVFERTYTPDIASSPDDFWLLADAILGLAAHPVVVARLADAHWQRANRPQSADRAISAYFDAAHALILGDGCWDEALAYAARAATLARTLRRPLEPIHESLLTTLEKTPDQVGALAKFGALLERELLASDALWRAYFDRANRSIEGQEASGGIGFSQARFMYDVTIPLLEKKKDQASALQMRRRKLENYVSEYKARVGADGMLQRMFLGEAIALAQELHDVPVRDYLLGEKTRLARHAIDGMETHEFTIEITRKEIQASVDALLQRVDANTPTAVLPALGRWLGLWPSADDLLTFVQQRDEAFLCDAAVHQEWLMDDGRSRALPDEPDARHAAKLHRAYVEHLDFALPFLELHVRSLRSMGIWTAEALRTTLTAGCLYDATTLTALAPALDALEQGSNWLALHVLVPQIERVIRALAAGLGVNVHKPDKSTGEIRFVPLDTLLGNRTIADVLNEIASGFAVALRAILTNTYGYNLRNEIAHGILAPHNRLGPAALAVLILLELARFQDVDESGSGVAPAE